MKMDAHDTYLKLLKDISDERIPINRRSSQFIKLTPGDHLSIGHAGFSSRRWVTYADQYLRGGPQFEQFLDKAKGTWEFDNDAGHKKGACITSLTIDKKIIRVKSRALLLAPTGILDFKLLNMVANQLDLPVEWEVDQMNVTWEFLVAVSHLLPKTNNRFTREFWERRKKNEETSFQRHAHQYHDSSKIKEETNVIRDNFTFSILRDFTWLYSGAVDGWKDNDRIFTRALKSWRLKDGWVWASHPTGMVKELKKHIPNLPSIDTIAESRSRRLSKKGGTSEQSKVIGYLKRKPRSRNAE